MKDTAVMFRDAARNSIGSHMPAKSLELKHTIPGINYRMGAMILAEIGDFSRLDSADKILAYAGMSPSTYQSGQLNNCFILIWKNEVPDIFAMPFTTQLNLSAIWTNPLVHIWKRKRSKGKHYNVTLSHAIKKLVRLIFAMEKSGHAYMPTA